MKHVLFFFIFLSAICSFSGLQGCVGSQPKPSEMTQESYVPVDFIKLNQEAFLDEYKNKNIIIKARSLSVSDSMFLPAGYNKKKWIGIYISGEGRSIVTAVVPKDRLDQVSPYLEGFGDFTVYGRAQGASAVEAVFGRTQEGIVFEIHRVEKTGQGA